jgi:outer membrane protein insertion porin family
MLYSIFRLICLVAAIFCNSYNYSYSASKVERINITGNQRINIETILANLSFKENDIISSESINQSIKNLYSTGYFADILIEVDQHSEDRSVSIKVLENPIINEIYLTGDTKLKIDDIKKELSLKVRGSYSRDKVKGDLDKLYGVYQKMGNLNVYIEPRVVFLSENRVDIIFHIKEGPVSYISNLLFIGNNKFSNIRLKEQILLSEKNRFNIFSKGGKFEEDKLDLDKDTITKFYLNNGYADVKILSTDAGFSKKDNNFILSFFIEEGDVYKFRNAKIKNLTKGLSIDEKKYIVIKKGQKFSQNAIEESVEKISSYLNQNGFAFAFVDYEIVKNNAEVDIVFNIKEGQRIYINKISISGNVSTKQQVILRELLINEGDLYNSKNIQLSKDRLIMLGYFKNVEFKENLLPKSDLIDIEILVEEQFSGSANFSLGYSSFEGLIGNVQASINNLLGRGYSGSIALSRSGIQESVNLSFFDPYFIKDYNIGIGINTFYSRFGDLGGGTRFTSSFPYSGYTFGGSLTTSFEITNRLQYSITTSIIYNENKFKSSFSYALYQQLIGTRQSYILSHSIVWNKMNKARYATQGFLLRYTQNYAGIGGLGTQDFFSHNISAVYSLPLLYDDLILHLSFDAGMAHKLSNKAIGIENLYTLGYYKMRGFSFYGLGPRIIKESPDGTKSYLPYAVQGTQYYVASLELRSPIFIPKEYGIQFATFMDAGSVWGFPGEQQSYKHSDGSVERVLDSSMIRISAGFGVVWQSPIGEIAFYFAKPLVKKYYDTPMQFNVSFGSIRF